MKKQTFGLLYVFLIAISSASNATNNPLNVHGFLTVGGTLSDSETPFLAAGDIVDHVRYSADTILGLQFDRTLNAKVRISAQFTANNRKNHYEANAQWLLAAFSVTPHSTIRAGRLRVPIFLQSASIYIGTAFPWVRPPVEMYELAEGVTSIVGVDLLHRIELFNRIFVLNPFFGEVDDELTLAGQVVSASTEGLWGVSLRHESLHGAVRLGYLQTDVTFSTPTFALTGIPSDFISFGFNYEWASFELFSEWAKRDINDEFLGSQTAWYSTLVYRGKHFHPYLTLALQDSKQAVLQSLQDSHSYTLGFNKPVAEVFVFKSEITYSKAVHGTRGLFQIAPPEDDNDVFVLSIAVTGTF